MTHKISPYTLKTSTHPSVVIVIHRGEGEHVDGEDMKDCECHPLVLSFAQINAHTIPELQELLDQHYRVH
jgi:hypothetical protein